MSSEQLSTATPDQILAAAAALFNAFTFNKLVPIFAAAGLFGLLLYMLKKAQENKDNNFDFGDFFREAPKGKLSWKRLVGFLCFIGHTWIITTQKIDGSLTFNDVVLYGGLWSGTATAMYALGIWRDIARPSASPAPAPLPQVPPNQEPAP